MMTKLSKTQRLDEWLSLNDADRQYHLQQWQEPKRSTVQFNEFVASTIAETSVGKVLDIGCGAGSATSYLAAHNGEVEFVGIDVSPELIRLANGLSALQQLSNLHFTTDDWFNLRHYANVDGVVSLQTLSWLPEFEEPLRQVFQNVSPKWVAISSLFYDGDISCRVEVEEHVFNKKCFYNIYALPAVDRFARKFGYGIETAAPFEIDIDIPAPQDKNTMGTYTLPVGQNGRRLQISGPLLMNWYFVMLRKLPA